MYTMRPAEFAYHRPTSLDEAIQLLSTAEGEVRPKQTACRGGRHPGEARQGDAAARWRISSSNGPEIRTTSLTIQAL